MASIRDREQMIDQWATIESFHERDLAVPTQESINRLYTDMYQHMNTQLIAAKRAHKPALFVFGETHPGQLGRSSIIVERIAIRIAHRLGIKNIYLENGPNELAGRKKFISEFEQLKKQDPNKYNYFNHKMNVVNSVIRDPIINQFNLKAAEPARGATFAEREKIMMETISKGHGSALYLVGLKHLKVCGVDARLNKKYQVSLINSQPKDIIDRIAQRDKEVRPADQELYDFALNSEKVNKFSVEGKLVDTDPDLLLAMVDKADKAFTPPVSKKSKASTTTLKEKLKAPTSVTPPAAPHLPYPEPRSSLSSTQYPTLAPSECGLLTSLFSNITQLDSSRIQPLFQLGMWVGAKFGLCPKPFSADVPFVTPALAAEASANRQLCKMGMTIDSSVRYLFGKKYENGDKETQEKMRKFVIDVVNGNVPKDIGEKFNAHANIGNAHERAKQLNKLMESTAGERCLRGMTL